MIDGNAMVESSTQLALNPLARRWKGQIAALQHLLACDPKNSAAWQWKIRVQLLMFLLARYGNQKDIDQPRTNLSGQAVATNFEPWTYGGRAPRSGEMMRVLLDEIAEANRLCVYQERPFGARVLKTILALLLAIAVISSAIALLRSISHRH